MEYIETIIVKYLIGTITDSEREILHKWIEETSYNREIFDTLCNDDSFVSRYRAYERIDTYTAKRRFVAHIFSRTIFSYWKRSLKYAAVFIPLIIITYYLYTNQEQVPTPQFALHEVPPGEYQARLILDNGFEMPLDDSSKSIIFDDSVSAEMISGTITYLPHAIKTKLEYNTIVVPRGGEYKLTLSDGTCVHLNSESSLRFPTTFAEGERKVYLTGEAYFEVVPNSSSRFVVEVAGTQVHQYGTVFNINSYSGTPEVVLVSGSIGITSQKFSDEVRLCPGQMARCGDDITVTNVNAATYIEWTKGRFVFDNRRLDEIADILSRWYNVYIKIDDEQVATMCFTGSVSRNSTIQHIMNAISYAQDVKVSVVGNIIKIYK